MLLIRYFVKPIANRVQVQLQIMSHMLRNIAFVMFRQLILELATIRHYL